MSPLAASCSAVVLAGGQSRRMGRDKSLLPVDGVPLLQRAVEHLERVFPQVLVVASRPGAYPFLRVPVLADLRPGEGPMMGILTGLLGARHDPCFVVACDIPEVDLDLVESLLGLSEGADVVVPALPEGHLEPLFAVYRRSMIPHLERALARGDRRVIDAYTDARVHSLDLVPPRRLPNLNRPADWQAWVRDRSGLREET